MSKGTFDAKLARVDALRLVPDSAELVTALRRALADRNAFVVSRAAPIVAQRRCVALVPDLLAACERLFDPAPGVDPLVRGKLAIVQALVALEHRDAAAFRRGLAHVQLEPVYGGKVDVAGPLRAACALALAGCDIDAIELLTALVDRLVDTDKVVRIEVAGAIAAVGGTEAMLLLRLKALAGDDDAEVTGAALTASLAREGDRAVAFVERFLDDPDPDVRLEAVSALAGARAAEAFAAVRRFWERDDLAPNLRRATVLACGASPLPAAATFLLELIADEHERVAESALSALAAGRFRATARAAAEAAVARRADRALTAAFAHKFPPEP